MSAMQVWRAIAGNRIGLGAVIDTIVVTRRTALFKALLVRVAANTVCFVVVPRVTQAGHIVRMIDHSCCPGGVVAMARLTDRRGLCLVSAAVITQLRRSFAKVH